MKDLFKKKIPVYFYCILGLLFWTNPILAQKTITLNLNNQKITAVIEKIESNTDYTFFYNSQLIDTSKRVTVKVNNASIEQVLDQMFKNSKIAYQIKKNDIILTPTKESKPVQNKKIQGTVTDEEDLPIIGASILVKGEGRGTITDIDGNYSIEASSGDKLEFSYMGYKNKTLVVGSATQYNIHLSEDTQFLDEVVVIGYGTQNKKTLTGAVSVVKMDATPVGSLSSASHGLAGKAAGMRVNMTSAQPGGAVKIRIRGEGSDMGSNEPLVVIDGFPIQPSGTLGSGSVYNAGSTDNVLESLNPEDIESITVLKDAASTAIYGARAGHGVILVTTKRGTEKALSVNYSTNMAVHTIANNYEMLNAPQFMDMYNRQQYEQYMKENGLGIYEGYIKTPSVVPAFQPKYSNDEILRAKTTDWLDEVTRTGFMQQHNVSMTGGTKTTKYLLSANYMQQEGVVKNNNASRMSVRLNLDQEVSKYINVGITANYTQNQYDNVPLGDGNLENSGILTSAIQANPTLPIRDSDGNYTLDPARSYVPNPVSLLEISDKTVKDRIMAMGYIKIKPIKELELKLNLGADRKFQKRTSYLPKTTLIGAATNGAANLSQMTGTDYLMDLTATFNKTFNEKHQFTALAGYSYQQFNNEWMEAGNKDFVSDALGPNNIASGAYEKPVVGSSKSRSAVSSFLARAQYNYDSRYLLEGTLRVDGQSNFHPDNRWGVFYSGSAGWVISEEPFMERTRSWLSNLKLRVSYGRTGNSDIGYHVRNQFAYGRPSIIGASESEIKGIYLTDLGNKDLTWEKTTEINVGLDFSVINGRFGLSVEYFNRKISDLLTVIPLLSYNEVNSLYGNGGATKGKGIELTFNTTNLVGKDYEWNTTLTLSHYTDRWAERSKYWKPRPYEKVNDYKRAWWSKEAIGILQPGETPPAHQPDLLPGMVILKDQNGDGKLDQNDDIYMGNGDPKLIFGLNNTVRYKNFDFNLYMYGELGRTRLESYYQSWTSMKDNVNVSTHAYKSFNHDNLNSKHPTFLVGGDGWGSYYKKNVSYLRVGSITVGYTIPIPTKIAKSVRVYVSANNPFVFTNWKGLDPETDNGSYPYPNIRSYNFGASITF